MPRRLRDFRDAHRGETILVCGCGASLRQLPAEPGVVSVGVNDVGRHFDPTYLVVLNPRSQFQGDRFRWVEASRAEALFTQLDLGLRPRADGPEVVRFRLGRRGGTDLASPDRLPYTRNSPYVAVCLAAFMGARKIGLIGVDFTDGHFFADTGRHPLTRSLARINAEYAALARRHADREIVNLSPESRLTALPKVDLGAFLVASSTQPDEAHGPPPRNWKPSRRQPMHIAIERRKPRLLSNFLDALAESAGRLGHSVSRNPRASRQRRNVLSIVWNGRRHKGVGPTLYCEHGWLPRWDYQVSPAGINADHHAAPFRWDGEPLTEERLAELQAHLDAIRRGGPGGSNYMQTRAPALDHLPREFLLVPLQMERDTNILRHAPRSLRRMQALIDQVSAWDPPWPVIFKQHPADARKSGRQLRLRTRRRGDALRRHREGNIHQLLKSGHCRGILSLNSNVVHDGLIWEVPALVLGKNVWPRSGQGPFLTDPPDDWGELERQVTDPQWVARRLAYADFLRRTQWTLDDVRRPERVAELLATAPAAAPPRSTRRPRRSVAVGSRPRHHRQPAGRGRRGARREAREPLVNVVAADRGWFFEDLKRYFDAAGRPGRKVMTSEHPLRRAGSWIFIRTQEAAASPDPRRTVVQVHDSLDAGLYRPGGRRAAVAACGGISLTLPGQRSILEGSGISLQGKRLLEDPIGALSAFQLRRRIPERFTVGWVGRPAHHFGEEVTRIDRVVEALRALEGDFRVVLVGERLKKPARELRVAGVDCAYRRRRNTPIERHPEVYREFDCLVTFPRLESGSWCLHEALAAGVPVVSSPVGWAPRILSDGVNGYLVESVSEMVAALGRIRDDRAAWFSRRDAIRGSSGGHTLEGWVEANLELALGLARRRAA